MAFEIRGSVKHSNLAAVRCIFASGNYVYACSYTLRYFHIIDVSDSDNPQIVGSLYHTDLYHAIDVCVIGDFAYVVTGTDNKMVVINVSTKITPSYVRTVAITACFKIEHYDHYLFCASDNNTHSIAKLAILNIIIPGLPLPEGYIYDSTGTYKNFDFVKKDKLGYCYLFSAPFDTLVSADIRGYFNPVFKGIGTLSFYPQASMTEGNYFYYKYNGGVVVVDVSNPASPNEVGFLVHASLLGSTSTTFIKNGNTLYLTSANAAVVAVDVSTPSSPSYIAEAGGASSDITTDGTYLYVSYYYGSNNYLKIYNLSLTLIATLQVYRGRLGNLKIIGDYLYGITGSYLQIFDVSIKSSPTVEGELNISSGRMEIVGNNAFISSSSTRDLYVVDVSNKAAPSLSTTTSLNAYLPYNQGVRGFHYNGAHLWVYSPWDILKLDISVPTAPVCIAKHGAASWYGNNSFSDTHYYGFTNDLYLKIYDLSEIDSFTPMFLDKTTSIYSDNLRGLDIDGNNLVATSYNKYLNTFNVSDKEALTPLGRTLNTTGGEMGDVFISSNGDYAIALDITTDAILVFDISTIASPSFYAYLTDVIGTRLNGAYKGHLKDGKLYVAAYYEGAVTIVDVTDYSPYVPPTTFTPKVMVI